MSLQWIVPACEEWAAQSADEKYIVTDISSAVLLDGGRVRMKVEFEAHFQKEPWFMTESLGKSETRAGAQQLCQQHSNQ
jgi:hypothetical protein